MGNEAIATCLMRASPDEATRSIRRVLTDAGLTIAADLGVRGRIWKAFGIDFPGCRFLLVDCPAMLLESLVYDRSAAVLIPLHIVIAEKNGGTVAHVLNPSAALYDVLPVSARAATSRLVIAVRDLLESMSVPEPWIEGVSESAGTVK